MPPRGLPGNANLEQLRNGAKGFQRAVRAGDPGAAAVVNEFHPQLGSAQPGWAWAQLDPWLEIRRQLPIGAVLCLIHGPTAGRRWEAAAARKQLHHAASAADVRRRFAPHQLRHAHAVEMAHEGVPLVVIQRQLGHANLGITSVYLQGIDSSEIISTVHGRPSPTISATAGLEMTR